MDDCGEAGAMACAIMMNELGVTHQTSSTHVPSANRQEHMLAGRPRWMITMAHAI